MENDNQVPEADGLNSSETLVGSDPDRSGSRNGGGQPGDFELPKRWRAYYRAVKRKEAWALKMAAMSPLQRLMYWVYSPYLKDLVFAHNPLLALIPKTEDTGYFGKYVPIPIIYGDGSNENS